jgi:hypothetical protein
LKEIYFSVSEYTKEIKHKFLWPSRRIRAVYSAGSAFRLPGARLAIREARRLRAERLKPRLNFAPKSLRPERRFAKAAL